MNGKIKNFYACGNTARGFYNFFESVLTGLERVFILKGGPGTGKSSLMRKIGEEMIHKGFDIEFIHCSSDNNSLDGIIIPKLKAGIVDGTAPHVIEPKTPGAVEEYVNLGVAWNSKKLALHKTKIQSINQEISNKFQEAYNTFAEALKIHDEWEKIYINNMNFDEANKVADELIQLIFGTKTILKESKTSHRFLGAATPQGPVDYIPNLTEDISKRYFIKGRPGTGKSTLLKKLALTAKKRGFDVEIYHCGFDPNSLDMIILPELGIAVFDSTPPHEYFPSRGNDEIVNMYTRVIKQGTDEKYSAELLDITTRYSKKIKEAISYLAEAKALHDELEKIYVSAMDFNKVEQIRNDILHEINKLM